jgi:hypothetical protein
VRTSAIQLACACCTLAGAGSAAAAGVVAFAFDQASDRLLRIEDRSGDGDTNDAGEVTVFMNDLDGTLGLENAIGLAADGAWRLFASDSAFPTNVLRLRDLNRDGDALDAGESVEWWNCSLGVTGGVFLPVGLTIGPDPAGLAGPTLYVVNNNATYTKFAEAIYRLRDADGDGVIAVSEVQTFFTLSPALTSDTGVFDVEFDAFGAGYVIDAQTAAPVIRRIAADGAGIAPLVTQAELLTLTGGEWRLDQTLADMAWLSGSDELVVPVLRGASNLTGFLAVRDRNADGLLNAADEWRLLWDEGTHAGGFSTGTPRDLQALPGGPLLWADATTDRIWRLDDRNGDGDFQDAGETTVFYDSAAAGAAGLPRATLMLSLTAGVRCSGDVDDDGDSDLDDLLPVLANFGLASGATVAQGDLSGDQAVNLDDLLLVLAAFGQSCGS